MQHCHFTKQRSTFGQQKLAEQRHKRPIKGKQIRTNLSRQRGDILIESLIGLVLMAIIGVGQTYVSSRALVAQKNMRLQEIAINQMRNALMNHQSNGVDLCTTAPTITLPGQAAMTATVNNCGAPTTVNINNTPVANVQAPLTLSLDNQDARDLFGGDIVVGGTW